MSLTLTLKVDLSRTNSHMILFLPGQLLRAMNDCWELCFVPHVRLDKVHLQRHRHKHAQPLDLVPYYEVLLPKRSLCETTSQPSGLCGPYSSRSVQPSRCCLSGPAINTAWWDWHNSACVLSQNTQTHTIKTHTQTHFSFLFCIFFHTHKSWSHSFFSFIISSLLDIASKPFLYPSCCLFFLSFFSICTIYADSAKKYLVSDWSWQSPEKKCIFVRIVSFALVITLISYLATEREKMASSQIG